jgi:hypothetical protein
MGMEELKALVQDVRSQGIVTIGLDLFGTSGDRSFHYPTLNKEEKDALVTWLNDDEPVKIKAHEARCMRTSQH